MKKTTVKPTKNNSIQYFIDGENIFPQIIDLMESAQESIYVEVFLFYDDEAGMAMVDKLVEKAKAGLDVRVLISEKGTEFNKSDAIFDKFRKNNVKIVPTFPLPEMIKSIWDILDWVQDDSKDKTADTYKIKLEEPVNEELARKSKKIMEKVYKRHEAGKIRKEGSRLLKRIRKKVFRSIKFYDHRKIILVDRKRAFMGGMNFGNDYLFQGPASELGYFHDIGILVEGDVVKEVLKLFLEIWHLFNVEKTTLSVSRAKAMREGEGVDITALSSFPKKIPNDIRQAYIKEVKAAQSSIYIINLYLTDSELIRELLEAKKRGVEVHIISTFYPGKSIDSLFSRILYRGYFYLIVHKSKMRDAGIQLHHYTKYNVHAKVGMVDDRWVTIGSSNLDYSSLRNAMEINVSLTHRPFIDTLKNDLFIKDIHESHILDKKLSFFKKIGYFVCYKIFMLGEKYFI